MKKTAIIFSTLVGVLILLTLLILGDATDWNFKMGNPEMGRKHEELIKRAGNDPGRQKVFSVSDILDTALIYGIDSNHLFFPDTFLTIRINSRPFIILLDSDGRALEISVCNAHFPEFNEKIILELPNMKVSKNLSQTYDEYLDHLLSASLKKVDFIPQKRYTIIMGFDAGKYSAERNIFFESVLPYLTGEIDFYLISKDNYKELNLSLDLRNERFVRWAYSDGVEFSDSTLAKYGLK